MARPSSISLLTLTHITLPCSRLTWPSMLMPSTVPVNRIIEYSLGCSVGVGVAVRVDRHPAIVATAISPTAHNVTILSVFLLFISLWLSGVLAVWCSPGRGGWLS